MPPNRHIIFTGNNMRTQSFMHIMLTDCYIRSCSKWSYDAGNWKLPNIAMNTEIILGWIQSVISRSWNFFHWRVYDLMYSFSNINAPFYFLTHQYPLAHPSFPAHFFLLFASYFFKYTYMLIFIFLYLLFSVYHFSSVTQSYLCKPMDCSMPGFHVHHQLPEFTQTHYIC